jgi:hypothetical protein
MTDDLVKRLRNPVAAMRPTITDGRLAADRIKALTAQLAEDADVRTQIDHRIEELVAQVDALTAERDDYRRLAGIADTLARECRIHEYRAEAAEADNAAIREAALREAADSLLECSVWCESQERTDDGWRNGVTDARKYHAARILALIDNTAKETK